MTDWLLSVAWYAGFASVALGASAIVKPMPRLRLSTRWRGVAVVTVSAAGIVANATWSPAAAMVSRPTTKLDAVAPAYHFREVHTRQVEASPARVRAAIKALTADEIALFSLFTAVRRFGRTGPESILNAPPGKPVLDVATSTGFMLLADDGREVVVGTVVAAPAGFRQNPAADVRWFTELAAHGVVKATMNFLVQVDGQGAERTRLSTETRIFATDDEAARRFTPYWRTIFPGSWILRATWLRAIVRRAES